jgi:hypothetical protein
MWISAKTVDKYVDNLAHAYLAQLVFHVKQLSTTPVDKYVNNLTKSVR